jgi:L-lysine exporter family protein LysE/ArgO
MLLEKILLGVTLAAPIGPVSIEMINRGLRGGFFPAFSVRLGGAIGNTLCLVGAYFGLAALSLYPSLFNSLSILGALFLFYTGTMTLLRSRHKIPLERSQYLEVSSALRLGVILAIVNPVGIMFWCGTFAATLSESGGVSLSGLLENFSIILGVLLWGAALSLLLQFGRQWVRERSLRIVSACAGLLMMGYAVKYGLAAIERF